MVGIRPTSKITKPTRPIYWNSDKVGARVPTRGSSHLAAVGPPHVWGIREVPDRSRLGDLNLRMANEKGAHSIKNQVFKGVLSVKTVRVYGVIIRSSWISDCIMSLFVRLKITYGTNLFRQLDWINVLEKRPVSDGFKTDKAC